MSIQDLKNQAAEFRAKGRALKTKKAREKAFDKARELEREVFILLCAARDTYAEFSMKCVVESFRDGEDYFIARDASGEVWFVSPTCDVVSKSWYASTCCVSYTKGQTVVIEFEVDVDREKLKLVAHPNRVHGGTLNTEKYAELDKRTDLAFFKHSSGGMTGLFSLKGA